ncbi:MAG: TonB-dependent receptor, partial [Methylococcaceae bacterium]|nr:TonB-dependent receptor [Methylococcaceae bacterium]
MLAATSLASASDTPDITQMEIEQLMQMTVTSVSKKSQKLSDTAAAVYVITQEEIRRSGVTSIPEALRLAPGIQVARIDANKWAITARGFNGHFANKLLVLMDGRSVYTPTFGGVYWESQNTVLDDIDRIEVIRGPGASVWGANAVNGVINIITKSSDKTRGGQINIGGGSEERVFGSVRYGFDLGAETHGRVYFKGLDRDRYRVRDPATPAASDAWDMQRGGFRLDRDSKSGDILTLQGDAYTGTINQVTLLSSPPAPHNLYDIAHISGWNLLGRWKKALALDSDFTLQFYYDHAQRNEGHLSQLDNTLDLDFQHHFAYGERQDIVWGLGYRYIGDQLSTNQHFQWRLDSRNLQLFSGFLQDEFTLLPNALKLTVGSKLEHNDFTGWVVQPSARLSWTPANGHALWGAVSRAVRTPNRIEQDSRFFGLTPLAPFAGGNPTPFPVFFTARGRTEFQAEDLVSFEIGHRFMPTSSFSLDTALFYNVYNRLRSFRGGAPALNGHGYVDQPVYFYNDMRGNTYGAEIAAKWAPLTWWTLEGQYTYLGMDLRSRADRFENSSATEAADPAQQWSLRSGFDLPLNLELDFRLRY